MNQCKQCNLGNHEGCTGTLHSGEDSPKCQCSCEFAPNAVYQAAKDRLRAAIMAFYATIEPDAFVDDWVLIVHKETIEATRDGQSVIGISVPTGQAFHRTSGLVLEASKVL